MNCAELRQDIEEFEGSFEPLKDHFLSGSKSGVVLSSFNGNLRKLDAFRKSIVEKYLNEFKEKNPESFMGRLSDRIDGFEKTNGYLYVDVENILPVSDGGALITTNCEKVYYCSNENGRWKLNGFASNFENDEGVTSIPDVLAPMQDGGVMIGGDMGVLYYCDKKDGKWDLSERIDGFEDMISYIAPMSDGGALVGGDLGELGYCAKELGRWQLAEKIDIDDDFSMHGIVPLSDGGAMVYGTLSDGGIFRGAMYYCEKKNGWWYSDNLLDGFRGVNDPETRVHNIVPISDSELLVGGNRGAMYYCKKEKGHWRLSEFSDTVVCMGTNAPVSTSAIAPMPDGGALIGGEHGALYYCAKENGQWRLSERIEGFRGIRNKGAYAHINTILPLPDGGALIGGERGALCYCCKENGQWCLSEFIDCGKANNMNYDFDIRTIMPVSDDAVLICGAGMAPFYCSKKDGHWQFVKGFDGFKDQRGDLFTGSIIMTSLMNGQKMLGGYDGALYVYDTPTTEEAIERIAKQ